MCVETEEMCVGRLGEIEMTYCEGTMNTKSDSEGGD